MKKFMYSTLTIFVLLVSCNQKNKEATTNDSHMMGKDTTMMDNDATMMNDKTKMMDNDTTMMNDKTKMMDDQAKIYACPMHPEVQGKLNDKCPKCGMKLTEPVE